jgi:carbonic anhydrase
MNITAKNVTGNCDLKCSYNFGYSESSTTATNHGTAISLSYDPTSEPPVKYNGKKYTVSSILIYYPSMHLYNGVQLAGEILIMHTPVNNIGNSLAIFIPLKSSTDSSTASQIITEIINIVKANAPAYYNKTTINIASFNLQDIVPQKPYYFYTSSSTDVIVYGDTEAIPLSSGTISTLQQIIMINYKKSTPQTNELFYNSAGPTLNKDLGNGIYISCQPTGSSNELMPVEFEKKNMSSTFSLPSMFQNDVLINIIMVLISVVVFMVIFKLLGMGYDYANGEVPEFITKIKEMINSKTKKGGDTGVKE